MQNGFYLKINKKRCRGCVKCIRKCPTEAIRGSHGAIEIISKLCIGCGQCIHVCPYNAIELVQDDWESLCKQSALDGLPILPGPTFYVQAGHCNRTSFLSSELNRLGFDDMNDIVSAAYDISAYAIAKRIAANKHNPMPLISSYCPAIIRYIQIHYPELVNCIVDVDSPHETAASYYCKDKECSTLALVAPCPAVSSLKGSPVGRKTSNITHVVNMKQVVKGLLAKGGKLDELPTEVENRARWLVWAASGGESKHVAAFSEEKIKTMTVSGMENIPVLLDEIELGRLSCIDYVECRACYMGCVGGISASESRHVSLSRIDNLKIDWEISEEERAKLESLYDEGRWKMSVPIEPLPEQAPLSDEIEIAMARLKEMKNIQASLPGLDCGSCGRPSCRAMAEDIVCEHGEITDCIFKLKEKITLLSSQINELCVKKGLITEELSS